MWVKSSDWKNKRIKWSCNRCGWVLEWVEISGRKNKIKESEKRLEEKNNVTTQQIIQCNVVAVCRWKVETESKKLEEFAKDKVMFDKIKGEEGIERLFQIVTKELIDSAIEKNSFLP